MNTNLVYRSLVISIVKNHNYKMFSNTFKAKFKFVLNYIDKWNPLLIKYNSRIVTKIYQFYFNNKTFGICHNKKCSKILSNVSTFNNGYSKCCSKKCLNEYCKIHFKGKNNPNYNHKWSDEQKLNASNNTKRQMQNYYYRFIANQPKTEAAKISKSKKISLSRKGKSPAIKGKHHTLESKKLICIFLTQEQRWSSSAS